MLKIYYDGGEYVFSEVIKENYKDDNTGTATIKTSKVKTLASVDVEVINNINLLVKSLATDNRFNQGIQVLTERGIDMSDRKNTREFITWVKDDIIKEDKDTILASGLDFGKVIGSISAISGKWYNARPVN